MSTVLVDDHLLADLIGDTVPEALARVLRRNSVATTNLFYVRLCRAAVAARGGSITGGWDRDRRQEMARSLLELPEDVQVLPMQELAFRMATLARDFGLSTLGAEAVAAAETRGARLCVWSGDVGPRIREACTDLRIRHQAIERS